MTKGKLGSGVAVSVGVGVGGGGKGVGVEGGGVEVALGVQVGTRVGVSVGGGVGVSVGIGVIVAVGLEVGLGWVDRTASLRGVAVGVAVTSNCSIASHKVRLEPKAVKATNTHAPLNKTMIRARIHLEFFLFNAAITSQAKRLAYYTIGCLPEPTGSLVLYY
jgi:hypothetical protein